MWHAVLGGALLAISIAAPPGPVTTIMANCAMRGRVRESLLMAAGAILGDMVWLGLAIIGVIAFLDHRPHAVGILGLVGAALLLWMAWRTWQTRHAGLQTGATPGSMKLGIFTTVTSPFSFAWWLANGSLLYTAWGWPGIATFFVTGSLYAAAFTYVFRWVGRKALSAIVWVAYVSVVMLAGFGLYVGWTSLRLLHV